MKNWRLALVVSMFSAPLLMVPVWAAGAAHSDKEIQEDIQKHKAMAAAHDAAAKCLEGGKAHDACMKELQASCKGLAIGKFCGMKHEH